MAKLNQGGRKQFESPQVTADNSATPFMGGTAPTAKDIVKSANARGGQRHEMKSQNVADEAVLPNSGGSSLDKDGIHDTGYIVKKNLEFGNSAFYNSLPPGMDIEDQENSDIRKMGEVKTYKGGMSYPGDGGF